MKYAFLIAAASALALSGAAAAKPGNGHGHGHGYSYGYEAEGMNGYGRGGCPPGLAKKAVPCMPPGQAKKLFGVGQRVPYGYGGLMGYNGLPYSVRNYYGPQLNPYSRYIYDNGYVYRVDPRTMVVQQILSALTRGY
jgi:hypothetical protein